MMTLERELGSTYSRKDGGNQTLVWGHVERRPIEYAVRGVNQMEDSHIT
jgi:hypothetical protein